MAGVVTTVCKYIMIVLAMLYTIGAISAVFKNKVRKLEWSYYRQNLLVFLMHAVGYFTIVINTQKVQMVIFYVAQVLFFVIYLSLYRGIYRKACTVLLNHMLFLLSISFIMLARLSFDKALRQFIIVCVAAIVTLVVPKMFAKLKAARKWAAVTGIIGILLLCLVLASEKIFGANLAIEIGPISVQPSEFVKISYVLLIAVLFRERSDFKRVLFGTAIAGAHVLILVLATDLGGALIYFFSYLCIILVATKKPAYFLGGLGLGSGAAVIAYFLFSHVRARVAAWQDPWSIFYNAGNQLGNSLFGLASGGWFGQGLYQGSPRKIGVVEKDFIFSAITEEMGAIVAICVLIVSLCCVFMFIKVAINLYIPFYKLVGVGLACIYGVQVFLSVGGNIRFIPSTGVTIPLVSYGGSSILSTFIIFGIIQELYIKRRNEEDRIEKRKKEDIIHARRDLA